MSEFIISLFVALLAVLLLFRNRVKSTKIGIVKIDLADVVRDSETNKEIIRGLSNKINKLEEICGCKKGALPNDITKRIQLGKPLKFATRENPEDIFDLTDSTIINKIIESFNLLGDEASIDALVALSGEKRNKIVPIILYNNLAVPNIDDLNREIWTSKMG